MFPLWHVEPSLHPILQTHVQRGGDVLTHHPILKLQLCAAYDPRSRSSSGFQTEEVAEEIKMQKNAKISLVEMDEDKDMKDGIQAQIANTNLVIVNQSTEEQMD